MFWIIIITSKKSKFFNIILINTFINKKKKIYVIIIKLCQKMAVTSLEKGAPWIHTKPPLGWWQGQSPKPESDDFKSLPTIWWTNRLGPNWTPRNGPPQYSHAAALLGCPVMPLSQHCAAILACPDGPRPTLSHPHVGKKVHERQCRKYRDAENKTQPQMHSPEIIKADICYIPFSFLFGACFLNLSSFPPWTA